MKFKDVYKLIGDVPCSDKDSCRILYDFVMKYKPERCLELGCAWGKTACTVGAALQELGQGRLDSLDLNIIETFKPSVFENIKTCGLAEYIFPSLSQVSYTWQLMHLIEEHTKDNVCEPTYDFIFLDGAHTWETDSSAFFLATKLLKPGGWMLFDDVMWTINSSDYSSKLPQYVDVPADFRSTSHIERIVELLLKQSPDYENAFLRDNWAWARKKSEERLAPKYVELDKFYFKQIVRQKLRRLLWRRK